MFKRVLGFLALLSYWIYVAARIRHIAQGNVTGASRLAHYAILVAELVMTVRPSFLRFLSILSPGLPKQHIQALKGNAVPKIDILIPCCGESLDIILDTIIATCALDYPRDSYRIFILDDGNSSQLKSAIQHLAKQHPNLFYAARGQSLKGNSGGYKAGNLNYGIHLSSTIERGADFIAGLDADVIPDPSWLRKCVPYLLDDPLMGIIAPPQNYYNILLDDPLVQSAFPKESLHLRASYKCAVSQGSGYVARRAALVEIGGFPTDTLAEDGYCSLLLLASGWKTSYVLENLQSGLIADSFLTNVRQRTRWIIGDLQVGFRLHFFFFPGSAARTLTVWQKLCGLILPLQAIHSIALAPFAVTYMALIIAGYPLVYYKTTEDLRLLAQLASAMIVFEGIQDIIACRTMGFRHYLRFQQAPVWMSPYHFEAFLRHYILPTPLGGRKAVFSATGSKPSTQPPSERKLRTRLQAVLWHGKAIYHILFIAMILCAVYTGFSHLTSSTETRMWEILLTRLCWPPLLWLVYLTGSLVPITYAVFGSDEPLRDGLLVQDVHGVKRPASFRGTPRYSGVGWNAEHAKGLVMVNAVVVLVGSFWM